MSMITDVVVVAMFPDDTAIAAVNDHLRFIGETQQLLPLDMDGAGGFKAISARVYAASFNYVNTDELKAAFFAAPWRIPRSVTMCIDGDGGPPEHLTPVAAAAG